MTTTLFTPITLGKLQLKNRIVMAPLTRSRAIGNVPNELMEKYYRLRARLQYFLDTGGKGYTDY